jgi:hypothetical protein
MLTLLNREQGFCPKMATLRREYLVPGQCEFRGSELSFSTQNATLVSDGRTAHREGTDFTVTVTVRNSMQTITGRIVAIALIPLEKPHRWTIIMDIHKRRATRARNQRNRKLRRRRRS